METEAQTQENENNALYDAFIKRQETALDIHMLRLRLAKNSLLALYMQTAKKEKYSMVRKCRESFQSQVHITSR